MSGDDQNRADQSGGGDRGGSASYSIGELAALGEVSRRTVRYYVQRGLLEAPTGLGRGRHYTQGHLDTLIRIRKLQEAGRPLAEIAVELASPATPGDEAEASPCVPKPAHDRRVSRWTRFEIADGIELHLRDTRLDPRRAESVVDAIRRMIRQRGLR